MADYKQIRLRRDTWAAWEAANPLLDAGEPVVVIDPTNEHHGEHRTGDGLTHFLDLPLDDQKSIDAVAGKVDKVAGGLPATALSPAVQAALNRAVSAALTVNGLSPDANGNIAISAGGGNVALNGVRYVAYGHSFGQQQVPTNAAVSSLYPARVRDDVHADVALWQNQTVSGATTAMILAQAKSTWQQGDYGLVTFMGNQNDVGTQVSQATFKANVRGFINWVRGPGPFPATVVIVLDTKCTTAGYARYATPPTDADVDRFNQYLRDVVAEYPTDGTVVIADPATGWNTATMVGPDGQHPNDRGQAYIAQAIEAALAGTAFREGLNYGFATPAVTFDSFNRPNSTTSLGVNIYNQPWTILGGVSYGISGGQAYRNASTVAESAVVRNTGKADVDLSVCVGTLATKGGGPAWRASDANNFFVVDIVGTGAGNAKVYKRVAGAYTQIGSALSVEVKNGSVVRVTHIGNAITVYVDGVIAFTGTDATNNTATQHGFRIVMDITLNWVLLS